jgi:hypothetical protein
MQLDKKLDVAVDDVKHFATTTGKVSELHGSEHG